MTNRKEIIRALAGPWGTLTIAEVWQAWKDDLIQSGQEQKELRDALVSSEKRVRELERMNFAMSVKLGELRLALNDKGEKG